ncbi:hypothetical protein, partial [Burkholderia gladioli]
LVVDRPLETDEDNDETLLLVELNPLDSEVTLLVIVDSPLEIDVAPEDNDATVLLVLDSPDEREVTELVVVDSPVESDSTLVEVDDDNEATLLLAVD